MGARYQHDARLGRFWSVDPLAGKYPWNSPYAFGENRLVDGVEWEGLEWRAVKDSSGSVTSFRWVGSEGLDEHGNLLPDHYWTVVVFRELGPRQWPIDDFNATASVGDAYGNIHDFRASTLPTDNSPALRPGFYIGYLGRHALRDNPNIYYTTEGRRAYPAVNLYGERGNRINLPAVSRQGQNVFQQGINIHRPGNARRPVANTQISMGCFTIDPRFYLHFLLTLLPPGQDIDDLESYRVNPELNRGQRAIGVLLKSHDDPTSGFSGIIGIRPDYTIRHSTGDEAHWYWHDTDDNE